MLQAQEALVARLLSEAKARRKDWTTYLLEPVRPEFLEPAGDALPMPGGAARAEVRLAAFIAGLAHPALDRGIVLPIAKRSFVTLIAESDDLAGAPIPETIRNRPTMAAYGLFLNLEDRFKDRTLPMVALDFRGAPDQITESLRWVSAPDTKNAGPAALPDKGQPAGPAVKAPAR